MIKKISLALMIATHLSAMQEGSHTLVLGERTIYRPVVAESICRICHSVGATEWLYDSKNKIGHKGCLRAIVTGQSNFYYLMEGLFEDVVEVDRAHIEAINAIREEVRRKGCPNIREFIAMQGDEKLQKIFNTVGLAAVINYKKQLLAKERRERQLNQVVDKMIIRPRL